MEVEPPLGSLKLEKIESVLWETAQRKRRLGRSRRGSDGGKLHQEWNRKTL